MKKIDYKRVDKLYDEGFNASQIAKKMNVSYPTVRLYLNKKKEDRSIRSGIDILLTPKQSSRLSDHFTEEDIKKLRSESVIDRNVSKSGPSDETQNPIIEKESGRNSDGTFAHGHSLSKGGRLPRNPFKLALLRVGELIGKDDLTPLDTDTNLEKTAKKLWADAVRGEYKAIEFLGRHLLPTPKEEVDLPVLDASSPKGLKASMEVVLDHMRSGELDVNDGVRMIDSLEKHRAFIQTVTFEENLKETQRQIAAEQERRKVEDQERFRQIQQLQELTRAHTVKQTLSGKK